MIDVELAIPEGTDAASFAKEELEVRWSNDGFEWIAAYSTASPTRLLLCSEQKTALAGISHTVEELLKTVPSALHHNHPSSDPLSPGDYRNFQTLPLLQEIHAYGHDRSSWYRMSVARPLPSSDIGDVPEIVIDNFLTAVDAPRDNGRIAFREGYAAAVAELTDGKYRRQLPTTYTLPYASDSRLSLIENCAKLATKACYQLATSPLISAATMPLIAVQTCIDGALSRGRYGIPVWQEPVVVPAPLSQPFTDHCSELRDWIEQRFA